MPYQPIEEGNDMFFKKFTALSILFLGFMLLSCSNEISDFERGKMFMKLGDYDNAVKSFKLAVWNQPDDAERHYYLGAAFENVGERKKAYKRFLISAKIGSKDISEKFSQRAWKWFKEGYSYRSSERFAKLAIIANEENPEAQFLYGIYNGYSGLPFLRDALDWSSDDKIVQNAFKYLKQNRELLTNAFLNRITSKKDGFEEFGPAAFSPVHNEVIWCRVKKNHNGRYQSKNIKLYGRMLPDTSSFALTTIGTSIAFPVCSGDSIMIYYSNKNRIYQFNRKDKTTSALTKGAFVDVNKTGDKLAFSKKWQIFISDTSGKTVKQLTKPKRYEYNFMPKFIHPKDNMVVFLKYSQNAGNLYFYKIDSAGHSETKIAKISRYGVDFDRPWRNAYDISPDGNKLVFVRDKRLFIVNINTGKEDTLHIFGDYPTFSPDGKKLLILTRKYGETGQVAIVDLDKVLETNTFFKEGKFDRKKMLRLLEKCTMNMEKEKFERNNS